MISSTNDTCETRGRISQLQRLLAHALAERDQAILDLMFEGVQLLSHDWRYLYLNSAACLHARQTREDLIGRTMVDCYPGIEETRMFALLRRCRDRGEPQTMENQFTYPDGRRAWFELRFQPVPEGVLVLSVDITERRRIEEELRQAQKMEAVGELAGGVAHDFNNILTAIMCVTSMAAAGVPAGDTRLRELLDQVLESAEQGARMTRSLLTLSRQTADDDTIFDVNDQLSALHQILRRTMAANVDVATVPSPQPAVVRGSAGQLQQILLNLAINAGHAMPDGGKLTLEAGAAPGSDSIQILVRDTGVGMDEETQARIFEPFFTTKGAGGTGLGLAICRRLVNAAGGAIAVDSAPGAGTTFTVQLPRCHLPVDEADPVPPSAELPRGPGRVLLVEDHPTLRAIAADAIRDCEFEVVTARSGEEALARLERGRPGPDAIVTDVMLPGMSGYDLLDAIDRQLAPGIPALVISGRDPGDRQDAGDRPLVHLDKPFTVPELLTRLHRLLRA